MITTVAVPRINANDDAVLVVRLLAKVGDRIAVGKVVAELQTEKAVVEVEAEAEGTVLAVYREAGTMVPVGATLMVLGEPGEALPDETDRPLASTVASVRRATAKAHLLAARLGISLDRVAADAGSRIGAAQVIATAGKAEAATPFGGAMSVGLPALESGRVEPLSPQERAMAQAVAWHGAVPVAGYLEVPFDHAAWKEWAKDFAARHRLPFDPLLGLAAYQLVCLLREHPQANATLVEGGRHLFEHVNMGFAVRTRQALVMVVIRAAETMDAATFVRSLFDLQRAAFANRLTPRDTQGATVAFTSIAAARRHVPVLSPYSSLIVAHSGQGDSIGASYDHRNLDGDAMARLLTGLSSPSPGI